MIKQLERDISQPKFVMEVANMRTRSEAFEYSVLDDVAAIAFVILVFVVMSEFFANTFCCVPLRPRLHRRRHLLARPRSTALLAAWP